MGREGREQRAAQAVGARGEAATQPLSPVASVCCRAVAGEGKAGWSGDASSLSSGQGLCSEAQERMGTAVCLSLWRALSWPEKPRVAVNSAPILGTSESLHQGLGIPWGNSVLSIFCLVCFLRPLREMLQQSDFLAFILCSQAHGCACVSLHL